MKAVAENKGTRWGAPGRALVCVSVLVAFCARSGEDPSKPTAAPVPFTPNPVTIDGKLNEACWAKAPRIRADHHNTTGKLSDAKHMEVRYAWDRNYFYLAYETFDANMIAKGTRQREGDPGKEREGCQIWGGAEKPDVVEFFISMGDTRCFWEIHHNALNQFNDIYCILADDTWPVTKAKRARFGILFFNKEHLKGTASHTVKMAVALKNKADGKPSTLNDPKDKDTGYTAEIRLPWSSLDAPTDKFKKPRKKAGKGKKEPGWFLEDVELMVLAVVQDTEQKERYFHSAPHSLHPWMHKGIKRWPRYRLTGAAKGKGAQNTNAPSFEERETRRIAGEMKKRADAGKDTAFLMFKAEQYGMVALWALLDVMDPSKEAHAKPILRLAARLGSARKSHKELLKLYEPAAYRAFYTKDGLALQRKLAVALKANTWPRELPNAMVLAAPQPTLSWLKQQARNPRLDAEKLTLMLSAWGSIAKHAHERQYVRPLGDAALRLSRSKTVNANAPVLAALLQFMGDVRCEMAEDFVAGKLAHSDENVRAKAAGTLGHLGGEKALKALITHGAIEEAPKVRQCIARAYGAWPRNASAGAAALALLARATDGATRRAIVYASAESNWPQRSEIVERALAAPQDGVLGVALQSLPEDPSPVLRKEVLAHLAACGSESPSPSLIDALVAMKESSATPVLARALAKEKNLAMQLKLIIGLEGIGGEAAGKVLVGLLEKVANPLIAEHLIAAIGRMKLATAVPALSELAKDKTAPIKVRFQCLWALGCIRNDAGHSTLRDLKKNLPTYFGDGAKEFDEAGARRQARLHVELALMRQGSKCAAREVQALFADGGPDEQMSLLAGLSEGGADHPIIRMGLKSHDFAVLFTAVVAAMKADPAKYAQALREVRDAPFVAALNNTGLDTWGFDEVLEKALAKAETKAP